jgi:hypothetical protein
MCNGPHHCVPLVEMVKKHIWNVQFGIRMRELCLRKNICLGYRNFQSEIGTSGLRPELPVSGGGRCSFARKWTTGTSGPRLELPVGTRTSGGAWPEVPIGLIPNLTLRSRTDLFLDRFWDVGNLENKPWRGFLLG